MATNYCAIDNFCVDVNKAIYRMKNTNILSAKKVLNATASFIHLLYIFLKTYLRHFLIPILLSYIKLIVLLFCKYSK